MNSQSKKLAIGAAVLLAIAAIGYYMVVPRWEQQAEDEVRKALAKTNGAITAQEIKASFFDKSLRISQVSFDMSKDTTSAMYGMPIQKGTIESIVAEGINPSLVTETTGVHKLFDTLTIANTNTEMAYEGATIATAHYNSIIVKTMEIDIALLLAAEVNKSEEHLLKLLNSVKAESIAMSGYTSTFNADGISMEVKLGEASLNKLASVGFENALYKDMSMDVRGMASVTIEAVTYGKFTLGNFFAAVAETPNDPDKAFKRALELGGLGMRDVHCKNVKVVLPALNNATVTLKEWATDMFIDEKQGAITNKIEELTVPAELATLAAMKFNLPALNNQALTFTKDLNISWDRDAATDATKLRLDRFHFAEPILGTVDVKTAVGISAETRSAIAERGNFDDVDFISLNVAIEDKELINSLIASAGQQPAQRAQYAAQYASQIDALKSLNSPAQLIEAAENLGKLLTSGGSYTLDMTPAQPTKIKELSLPNLTFVKSSYMAPANQ